MTPLIRRAGETQLGRRAYERWSVNLECRSGAHRLSPGPDLLEIGHRLADAVDHHLHADDGENETHETGNDSRTVVTADPASCEVSAGAAARMGVPLSVVDNPQSSPRLDRMLQEARCVVRIGFAPNRTLRER